MDLKDELTASVTNIFKDSWETRNGQVVPEPADLKLSNEAVEFDRATVLYADLAGSTDMVDKSTWQFAAEIYKTFLHCAAMLIRSEGGAITSYDGDRVMGIWIGNKQSTPAAKCGLKINYAVQNIINPALKAQYRDSNFVMKQVVGIDTSPLRAARTGVRGGNDIVWVGRAANYAAKLTDLDLSERTWITKEVFDRLNREVKYGGENNELMWKSYNWSQKNNHPIHGSTWTWTI